MVPRSAEEALDRLRDSSVIAALKELPQDFRTAVYLADMEGFSYREVADIMHCPVGTVMSRLHRARGQGGSRVRGRDRDLQGMRVDLLGETDRFLDHLGGLAWQADNKGAVNGDAEIPAVFGELAGPVDPDTFLDVDEICRFPDSYPTSSRRGPLSRRTFSVS